MKDGKMKTSLLLALALLVGPVALARSFDVTMWRGETRALRLPDFCELGDDMKGITIRRGALKAVKAAPRENPESLERRIIYDRVSWKKNATGPRVIELTVAPNAKPGVYSSGLLRVKVIDRLLPPPKDWSYYLDLWQHPWAVARLAKAEPFSKAHYAAMKPVWELLATAGQKTITVPILDMPWDHQCFDAYHSMIDGDDFSRFDQYVKFCLDCGLGPDISCYSLCPWTLGKTIDENELEKRWGPFLDKFAAHVKAKGWFKHTIMAMDERAPEDVAKVVRFVQKHAPGMRISMAGNRAPSDFKGITIDVYSQVLHAGHVTSNFLAEAASRQKKGLITTHYVCCWPTSPNTFLGSGESEAFFLGAVSAFLGLDGFLRWAWNSWPLAPTDDGSYGSWTPGDTFLCYPGGEPSWRFLTLRNGIVAAEKIRILKAAGALKASDVDAVARLYDIKAANAGRCRFGDIEKKTQELVNAPASL